jgi:hypothetical protein
VRFSTTAETCLQVWWGHKVVLGKQSSSTEL